VRRGLQGVRARRSDRAAPSAEHAHLALCSRRVCVCARRQFLLLSVMPGAVFPANEYQQGYQQLSGATAQGPAQQSMDADESTPLGVKSPGLILQQRNGWCDCRIGFSIQPFVEGVPKPNNHLPPPPFSLWQSGSFCARLCTCTPTFKQYNGDVSINQMDNEEALEQRLAFKHENPLCVCCPQMRTFNAQGAQLGRTVRQCTLCLPSYAIENGQGQTIYTLSPDSFLFCFPKCNLGGAGACCQIPSANNQSRALPSFLRVPRTRSHATPCSWSRSFQGGTSAIRTRETTWRTMRTSCTFGPA